MILNISRNNMNWKRVGGGLLVTLLTVYLAGCGSQGENANKSAATSTAATHTNANANTAAGDPSFKDAAMTWSHVEDARAKLDAAVEENNLAGVREPASKMRDSLNALPGQSAALSSDKREQLASHVKKFEQMVGMLDEVTASNNADSVHEHHKAMDESLDTIKGLYPEGVMPASMPMAEKMGEHGADKKMGQAPKKMDGMPKKKDGMKMPMKDH